MISQEFVHEAAIDDLKMHLPSLSKHNYDTIDQLLRKIAAKHRISKRMLRKMYIRKFGKPIDKLHIHKLDETDTEPNSDLEVEIVKFVRWSKKQLGIESNPVIKLSYDTQEAQTNHHTGSHVDGSDKIWVYVKNRNLVDILRTVFHELVHVRQGELNMIKDGSSYPGSAIEVMADAMAGKYIKIYGEQNHHIFQ